jgi:hypothetical protein
MMRLALRLLCAGTVATIATTALAQSQNSRRWNFDERYYRENEPPEDVAGTTKLCSVFVPHGWRDTIPVPGTWRWSDCRDFADMVGASEVHLMCMFTDGSPKISAGSPTELPEPNCGWGRRR